MRVVVARLYPGGGWTAAITRLRLPSGRYSIFGRNSADAVAATPQMATTTTTARLLLWMTARVKPRSSRLKAPPKSSTKCSRRWAASANGFCKSRLDSAGITVIATTSDSVTATEMATAMSRKSWPTSSFMIRTGMNTMTVVSADTSTALHTWRVPS